jgi:hypothetical protein
MSRYLAGVALVLAAAPAAPAQRQPGEPIPFTLHPAAAPAPSLKYRLLPDPREQQPGNAAALYYRCYAMFFENRFLLDEVKKEYWGEWAQTPLEELPRAEVAEKLHKARSIFTELEYAARLRDCDWLLSGRREGIGLLLPDVQGFRTFANLLAVRARLQIAEGKFDDAVATLRTGYTFAHHLGEHPTLIGILVGGAITNILDAQLDELMQQPGAPNLYWALATLPRTFLDPRRTLREESQLLENMLPWLKQLDEKPMTDAQVRQAMQELEGYLDAFAFRRPPLANLSRAAVMTAYLPEAKRYLREKGVPAKDVDAMPVFQATALAAFRRHREAFEETAKWAYVEDGFRKPGYREAVQRSQEAARWLDRLFFAGLLEGLGGFGPAIEKVFTATDRVDRRFAAQRCLEAISLYAAAHGGRLPEKLEDITEASAPADPATGKPFVYKAFGNGATLSAPLRPGEKPGSPYTLTYEITVQN